MAHDRIVGQREGGEGRHGSDSRNFIPNSNFVSLKIKNLESVHANVQSICALDVVVAENEHTQVCEQAANVGQRVNLVFGKVENLEIGRIFEVFDFLDFVAGSDEFFERNEEFLLCFCERD